MSSRVLCLILLAISCSWPSSNGQECLSSPPAVLHDATRDEDDEWEAIPGVSNAYRRTVTFDAYQKHWEDVNALITTRGFDKNFPSETWRFRRGNLYEITVVNNLGPESKDNPTEMNVASGKDGNTTNIHTHGLHLSGMNDADNVFIAIPPGGRHVYSYNVPCDHSGGTFWWHPHHHGSTHLQVAGGAAGALIIEDDAESEGLPPWYTEMEELIFFVTHLHFAKYTKMLPEWDETWSYSSYNPSVRVNSVNTWFVNGRFRPTVCQTAGEWTRFRFAHIETTENARIYYIGDEGECTLFLLARDGVIVHGQSDRDVPRAVGNGVFLAQSSRADVAVSCPGHSSGSTSYSIWVRDNNGDRIDIAFLSVTGTATAPSTELTAFTPLRPHYLETLMPGQYGGALPRQRYTHCEGRGRNEVCREMDYFKDVEVSGATIRNQKFDGETNYMATMDIDRVHIWEITAEPSTREVHPLHIHINHFQLINSTLSTLSPSSMTNWIDIPSGYQEEGDFLDTLWGPGFITFKTDTFAGTVTIHCHVLIHEDQGAMGTALIRSGCDGHYGDVGGVGQCRYEDSCGQFGTASPTEDTAAPSSWPTASPSAPTPTAAPSAATKGPTQSPEDRPDHETQVDLLLVLRGTLSSFLSAAESFGAGGSYSDLAEQCIAFAIDTASFPELEDVAIAVTEVNRGSVFIRYSLTSRDPDLLTLAEGNAAQKVAEGARWSPADDGSAPMFKLMTHSVENEQFIVADRGEWWQSTVVQAVFVGGLMAMCFLCGGGAVWHCARKRRHFDSVEAMVAAQSAVELHQRVHSDTVDIFTTGDLEDEDTTLPPRGPSARLSLSEQSGDGHAVSPTSQPLGVSYPAGNSGAL